MNAFDVVVVLAGALAACVGWRLGFIARAASWIGLALGVVLATQVLPSVTDAMPEAGTEWRVVVVAGVFVVAALLGQAIGMLVGGRLAKLALGPFRFVDRTMGGAAGAAGVLVSVWLLIPVMADTPGWMAREVRGSVTSRAIDRVAPRAPDTLQALGRVAGDGGFPRVFESLRRAPDTGPPPAVSILSPEVTARVLRSTVKVEGEACGHVLEGSGWTAGDDLVVTNAHVVAGERRSFVRTTDGRRLAASVVAFDPDRDVAVLRVRGLDLVPLATASAESGTVGAVFGHPRGQTETRVAPAAVRDRITAVGRDLYDARQTRREVFVLAADLEPGDSGGAVVDASGAVVGVAFAVAPDRPDTAYALTTEEIAPILQVAPALERAVPTGRCLTD